MFVLIKDKTINLDKFEKVSCRESLIFNGFPVEAVRNESGGFFGCVTVGEEIARFTDFKTAKELVAAITEQWVGGEKTFDVEKWISENDKGKNLIN